MKIKVDGDLLVFNFSNENKDCDCKCNCEDIVEDCVQQEHKPEQEAPRTYLDEFFDFCQEVLDEKMDYIKKSCKQDKDFIPDWSAEGPFFVGFELNWALNQFAAENNKVLDWAIPESISDWLNSPYEAIEDEENKLDEEDSDED